MITRLIGIHGFKGAGKTTLVRILSSKYHQQTGRPAMITNYADRLKSAAAMLFDFDPMLFYDGIKKEQKIPGCDFTQREILTGMHDGLVPVFGPYVFVDPVRRQWEQHSTESSGLFIVGDVRYDGLETDWIEEAGGTIIHIERPGCTQSAHSSERGIELRWNHLRVINDKDVKHIETVVDLWIRSKWLNFA